MSVLEFISSIKWPVTVLLIAAMVTLRVKRNPNILKRLGAWFSGRNIRLNVVGQEFEATIAEIQGSMDAATSPDSELVESVALASGPEGERPTPGAGQTEQEVESARRQAVARVARTAVRLGWHWARGEEGSSEPVVHVRWNQDGHPSLRVFSAEDSAREVMRMLRSLSANPAEYEALQSQLRGILRDRSANPASGQFRSHLPREPRAGEGAEEP